MNNKLQEAIELYSQQGIPPQYIAHSLVEAGWPEALVNREVNNWLINNKGKRTLNFKIWLKKYQQKALPAVIALTFVGTINSVVLLLKPWPTKIMVDSVFGNVRAPGILAPYTHKPVLILITSLMTLVIFLFGALIGTLKDYLLVRIGFWLNRGIKQESLRHILHLPLYHQQRLAKGDYVYRQNVLTNSLSDLVLSTTTSIFESIIMVIGVLIIMLTFNVKLTLISIIVIPFIFIVIRYFGPMLASYAKRLSELASKTASSITEAVDNAETVQSFTLEDKEIQKVDELWVEGFNITKKLTLLGRLFRSTNGFIIIIGTSTVMYLGGIEALNSTITLGQLLIFMTYMGYLLGPIENLATQLSAKGQKMVDASRIYDVLMDHPGIEMKNQGINFPMKQPRIEFRNVQYTYKDIAIIKNFNLIIEAGQKVAIIGPSGAGKSTILKLLPLFIEPQSGSILIDNIDIQKVSLHELRRKIAWIAQTPQLFSGTIYENILDADVYRELTQKEMLAALQVSNVGEFVTKFPLGLESLTGEGGGNLSGGQRQRVAIARGFLKNAPIVVMDEPTAALDSVSETYIRDNIGPMLQGRTVLMVTHRKPLLSLMDKVYVLENGVLQDVNVRGGLDAYLRKIEESDTRHAEKRTESEADKIAPQLNQQQLHDSMVANRLKQMERDEQAQKEVASVQVSHGDSDEGTIIIGH